MGQWGRSQTTSVFLTGPCIFPEPLLWPRFPGLPIEAWHLSKKWKALFHSLSCHVFCVDADALKVLWSGHRALLVHVPLDYFLKITPPYPPLAILGVLNSFVCNMGYIFWSRIKYELRIEDNCLIWPLRTLSFKTVSAASRCHREWAASASWTANWVWKCESSWCGGGQCEALGRVARKRIKINLIE